MTAPEQPPSKSEAMRRVAPHLTGDFDKDPDVERKPRERQHEAEAQPRPIAPSSGAGMTSPKKTAPNGTNAIDSRPSPSGLEFTWMKRKV
jgi:hypothetical protein